MRRWSIYALAFILVLLAGCNTVRGVGKDIEKAGETIQRSSK
jgi:predicted small secreted protein